MDAAPQHREPRSVVFRFYAELNEFLPVARRAGAFACALDGEVTVRGAIEALGVPASAVDLVIVDGEPVVFGHRLRGGERVAAYPVFEALDIGPVARLRPRPLRVTRFIADVHLGKLARYLRLLGFDTLYRNDYDDATLVAIARADRRVILTRDRQLLRRRAATHGYWLAATQPREQLGEVIRALDLCSQMAPFTRCLRCNGPLAAVSLAAICAQLPAAVQAAGYAFSRCARCGKVYWPGPHYAPMRALLRAVAG